MTLTNHRHIESGRDPLASERPDDTRPFLSIPYWESPRFAGDPVDTGSVRPLPAGVISWECEAIHASSYRPGEPLEVSVDVRNSGPGNATPVVTVIVYWSDPTVGFAHPSFFAATTVATPPMRDSSQKGFVTSPVMRGVIPAGAPDHICLLAVVTHALDKAPTIADPLNNRHWAQRNLIALPASNRPLMIPFVVANPFATEELLELRVQRVGQKTLELLALRKKVEASEARVTMRLLDGTGKSLSERGEETRTQLALGGLKRRRFVLALEADGVQEHQLTAIEAVLYTRADRVVPVGSLGITLTGTAVRDVI